MRVSDLRLPLVGLVLVSAAAVASPALAADVVPAGGADSAQTGSGAPPAMAQTGSGTLDGIWMFDAKHSDDPMKIMQANRPQGGRGGGGGGGWGGGGGRRGGGGGFGGGGYGGGGGGWGGGGGRRRGGGDADEAGSGDASDNSGGGRDSSAHHENPFARVMRPAKKVVIDMGSDQVTVTEDEGAPRAYAIQDSLKAHEHDLVTEGTSASWKGGHLVMSETTGRRGSLVESYELSADGRTLTIRAHREGGPEGMPNPTIVRVYTRYEGD